MKASTQFVGVMLVMAAVFALAWVPAAATTRALLAALVITIGGGVMAFLRSRKSIRR
jgi:hypothetical protein